MTTSNLPFPLSVPLLCQYVARMNTMRRLFKQEPIDLRHLTVADIAAINDYLTLDLSPENLTCDGEADEETILVRTTYLLGVRSELKTITP